MKNVALITGASSGLGREFADIHAKNGGDLVVVARSKDRLEALKTALETRYNTQVLVIVKDLGIATAPEEIYKEVKDANIKIDYLINNAGFGGIGKFHERDLQRDIAMINLNVTALTALTRLFVTDFVDRNSGKIMNVSSTASFMPGPLQAVYYATKAYVTSFSNAISEELSDTNVTITNLMPGATATEFGAISGMDKTSIFNKTADARMVAEKGYEGMLKGKLDVISGLTLSQKIMMSFIPIMPKKFVLKTIRQMQEVKK